MSAKIMEGVREYMEGMPVKIRTNENGRLVISADNEAGHNRTDVDLLDLLDWVRCNLPELVTEGLRGGDERR